MTKIEKKLDKIPSSPGIYLFKDKKGEVLYVGKAANLRARVRSYFRSSTTHSPVKRKLLQEIADVEPHQTESEIEALVKEAQLIKKLKPRFNVLMRDNKNYAYVVITKDKFPRIYITHQPEKDKNYIGPYTEVKPLKKTLRLLRGIFPYYVRRGKQSSVERQIGLTPPEDISPTEYKKNIRAIRSILNGRKKSVASGLEKEIKKAIKAEDFEKAGKLKSQLENLQEVMAHAHVLGTTISAPAVFADKKPNFKLLGLENDPERIEGYDISNIGGKEAVGSMVVFELQDNGYYEPNKDEYRKFKIKTVKGANDPAMIKEVLSRRIKHEEWSKPGLIVIDGGRAQLNSAIRAIGDKSIRVISLAKRQEDVYMPDKKTPVQSDDLGQATKHLLQTIRDETHRFAITYHKSRRNKNTFK